MFARGIQDGTPLVEFPKTFSAQVHLLMDQWKQRRKGGLPPYDLSLDSVLVPAAADSSDAEVLDHHTNANRCHAFGKRYRFCLFFFIDVTYAYIVSVTQRSIISLQVRHGMTKIAKLDEALREKQLEHLMVSRETYPEKWLKHDSDRIRKHGESVEAALRKKREEHARRCCSIPYGVCGIRSAAAVTGPFARLHRGTTTSLGAPGAVS